MAEQATLWMPIPDSSTSEAPRPKARTATIINKIHAAKSLDALFFELKNDLVTLFNVEQLTLYVVDSQKKELYARH